jgi:uncharacterized protein (DUF2267 family)
MRYVEFVEAVQGRTKASLGQADALTQATLQSLAGRITGDEARELAAQLPKELREFLNRTGEEAETFDLDEFVRRVSQYAGVDRELARKGVQAVFQTLHAAVSDGEFEDVMAQLSKEFQELAPMPGRRR